MKIPKPNKNIILIAALIIVAVIGYFTFFKSKDTGTTSTTTETPGVPVVGQELVTELNRLTALQNINQEIFTDPVFTSLKDYTQPVIAQPLGRANPFAPIGSDF